MHLNVAAEATGGHSADMVPGTVRLLTDGPDERPKPGNGRRVLLIPTPTESPNDPLNWSRASKRSLIVVLLVWTFVVNAAVAWPPPAWAVWVAELGLDYETLAAGQAVLVLACGAGVALLQPVAVGCGRRPAYLLGSLLVLAGLGLGRRMAAARPGRYFAYAVLAGLGTAPAYVTVVASLLDVAFLHEKGFYLGLYSLTLLAANFLPPVAAGYAADARGWRWCFDGLLVLTAAATLLLLLLAEESLFARDARRARDRIDGVAPDPPRLVEAAAADGPANRPPQKDGPDGGGAPPPSVAASATPPSPGPTAGREQRLGYFQRMTLFRRNEDKKAGYGRLLLAMLEVAVLPAAAWASCMLALASLVVSVVMTTQASFFSVPPYSFTAHQMGLMYLAILAGCLLGAYWGGPATDGLVRRCAVRRGGFHEPESRLWAYLAVPLAGAGGLLLYGLGAAAHLHWAVPCLGLALIGVYLNASLPVGLGYALDCYPELEAEIVLFSNCVRNVLGGALTFCIQPWINYSGPRNAIVAMAMILLLLNLTSVLFQIWGKKIRINGALRYLKICEKCRMSKRR